MRDDTGTKEELLHEIAILRERIAGLERIDRLRGSMIRMASFPLINPNPVIEVNSQGTITFFNRAAQDLLKKLGMSKSDVAIFVPEKIGMIFRNPDKNTAQLTEEVTIGDLTFSESISFSPEYDAACIYVHDITRYKRAEHRTQKLVSVIRRDRDRLSTLINSIQDEVWFANTRKKFTMANPVARREFGLDTNGLPVHVRDLTVSMEVFDADGNPRPLDRSPALRALAGETIRNEIEIIRSSQGQTRYREVSSAPVRDSSNKIVGSVSVVRDITERKNIEEALRSAHEELELRVKERTKQLQNAYQSLKTEIEERKILEERLRQSQKMEAIGTLAGGIAHDFNNILAGIIGFSEMVEEDLPEGSSLRGYMKNVLKASFRGRDLVKQILTFSRKAEHSRHILAVAPVIEDTVKLLRSSLPSTLELIFDPGSLNDRIHASAVELQQIVLNLVTNAARAIGDKGGIIHISLSDVHLEPDSPVIDSESRSGNYLQLTVKDTGEGISAHVMLRIFEPFFTTRGLGEGTGMGLAVVYGIVKGLGGTITVESEEGAGSTFCVYLPHGEKCVEPVAPTPATIAGGTERILFVDDEELLVQVNRDILEKLGYRVTALADSTKALDIFQSNPFAFDLVITDQTMPKLNGLRFARKLLKIRKDTPIILCTGHSDTVSPEVARDAGVRVFIMKPLARKELAEVIRSVLDKEPTPTIIAEASQGTGTGIGDSTTK